MSEEKYKLSRLITYLYETMNGELALDYANLDSENIEILLDYIEKLENIIKEVREKLENIYILSNVTISNNAVEKIDECIEILDKNSDKDITKKSNYNYEKVEKENIYE